ncbi:MAG TPA: IclR family transcriptional regulator C-terminal domain-containing protein, partial [Chitinophagaceae bacterium]|nr:IclR family transcriptional regulator C-terminal domain-containing protein [Chitinophagaceae bacterium]
DILEFLADEPDKQRTLGEIAAKVNLNAATCANIIKTLVERKYIDKLDKKKGYCLGSKAYGLTGNESYKKDVTEAAKEELQPLTKKIKENSLLAVLENDMRRVLVRVMSEHPIQASTAPEKRAYDSASGRCLVAMLPDAELHRFVKQYGLPKKGEWEGVKDEKSLMEQIGHIRESGYATQLTKEKIVGLAVPVLKGEKVVASLSIYMPQFRYNKSDKLELVNLMNQASRKITKKLK